MVPIDTSMIDRMGASTIRGTRSPAARSDLDRLLLAIAAMPLQGGVPEPPAKFTAAEFDELLDRCERSRTLGALGDAIERGEWELDDDLMDRLSDRLLIWLSHSLRLERTTLRVAAALGSASIPFRMLKGVALAHFLYGEPSHRIFVDLDILIRSDDLDEAIRVLLSDLDGVRPEAQVRTGFDLEFAKDVTIRVDDLEVDVHRTFARGPFGLTMDPEELFLGSDIFSIGGTALPTLTPTGLLIHGCFDAALGNHPPRLGSLRDLMLLVERWPEHLDDLIEMGGRWQAQAVIRRAAVETIAAFDLADDHPIRRLADVSVPWRQVLFLRSYTTQGRGYWPQFASLAVIPGVRTRARYLHALVRPSPEYLESRGWTERGHLRRAVRQLRGQLDD